jgi:hypothetical protein
MKRLTENRNEEREKVRRRGKNILFLLLFSAFSLRSLRLCGELALLTDFALDHENAVSV